MKVPPVLSLRTRREFLQFLGRSAAAASLATLSGSALLSACASKPKLLTRRPTLDTLPFTPVGRSTEDALILAKGFNYSIIATDGDKINSREKFGTNNDYTAFFPLNSEGTDGILWVNHEYVIPLFTSGWIKGSTKTRTPAHVKKEREVVGGSLIRIKKDPVTQQWQLQKNDPFNRRITGSTEIPIISARPIRGKTSAKGTFAGCAGGVTPWGTVLSAEENYDDFYGEVSFDENHQSKRTAASVFLWETVEDLPPEHYGWIVEINPRSGEAKKLTSIGRFAHECATVVKAKDNKCVVYSGDDKMDQYIYKFIANTEGSLETGTLYAGDTVNGRWLSLDINEQPILKKNFLDQTEVLIRAREAATLVGATKLARPEDIEIDPFTGDVFISLTSTNVNGTPRGTIMKIQEQNGDHRSLKFKASTFMAGGDEGGFIFPDNLAFDRNGNLWMTSDIAHYVSEKPEYKPFGNNGLFFIPLAGANAGKAFQVATAPRDAEFTGPSFSPDGRTLFLSVQHPGEGSKSLKQLTSHWPHGGNAMPLSSVVAIQGPALDAIVEKTT